MIWNESKECMSEDELAALQGDRLVRLVRKMYDHVEYYRKKMQGIGLEPGDICGIEDLNKLPFTTSEDLFKSFPYGTFAVPRSEITQYHMSAGITGEELIECYTENDIGVWGEFMARCFCMARLGGNDTIQVISGCGHSTGGYGAEYGAAKIGASFVASSLGSTHRLVTALKVSQATCIIGTPLCLVKIAQEIKERKLLKSLRLSAAICSETMQSKKMKQDIETMLNIKAYEIYGLNELTGSGIACECECHQGMHIQEDFFLTETLDSNTLTQVEDEGMGEFVFTTLQKEGFPLIRYRTRDLVRITKKKCACGRTFARIIKLEKQTGNTVMIRGNKVYLCKIESALKELKQADAEYLVRVDAVNYLDAVEVVVGLGEYSKRTDSEIAQLKKAIENAVGSIAGVKPSVSISDKDVSNKNEKKTITVVDNRKYR